MDSNSEIMNKKINSKSGNLFSSFMMIWFGQFISILGSGLTSFALGVYVFNQTQSATSFSLIILCVFLPPFFPPKNNRYYDPELVT